MSSLQKTHTVFGYVRTNYHQNVPEAIIKMCLKYFEQDFIVTFKGDKFKHILFNEYRNVIKFNQDLAFCIHLKPNHKGRIKMGLQPDKISDNIDYIIVCWTMICFDSDQEPLRYSLRFCHKFSRNKTGNYRGNLAGLLSQFQNSNQLSFKFIMSNLQIKYKTNKISYYP